MDSSHRDADLRRYARSPFFTARCDAENRNCLCCISPIQIASQPNAKRLAIGNGRRRDDLFAWLEKRLQISCNQVTDQFCANVVLVRKTILDRRLRGLLKRTLKPVHDLVNLSLRVVEEWIVRLGHRDASDVRSGSASPGSASHTLTVPSRLPETIRRPSELTAKLSTMSVCPPQVNSSSPDSRSQP